MLAYQCTAMTTTRNGCWFRGDDFRQSTLINRHLTCSPSSFKTNNEKTDFIYYKKNWKKERKGRRRRSRQRIRGKEKIRWSNNLWVILNSILGIWAALIPSKWPRRFGIHVINLGLRVNSRKRVRFPEAGAHSFQEQWPVHRHRLESPNAEQPLKI